MNERLTVVNIKKMREVLVECLTEQSQKYFDEQIRLTAVYAKLQSVSENATPESRKIAAVLKDSDTSDEQKQVLADVAQVLLGVDAIPLFGYKKEPVVEAKFLEGVVCAMEDPEMSPHLCFNTRPNGLLASLIGGVLVIGTNGKAHGAMLSELTPVPLGEIMEFVDRLDVRTVLLISIAHDYTQSFDVLGKSLARV